MHTQFVGVVAVVVVSTKRSFAIVAFVKKCRAEDAWEREREGDQKRDSERRREGIERKREQIEFEWESKM